ncbi:MAG: Na+/H+ antiporter NhaA [Gemmatimonadota bacterium]
MTSRLGRAARALQEFLGLEAAGGLLLMAASVLAMIVANSPLAGGYSRVLEIPISVTVGGAGISKALLLWINDGLMAVFFLLVGLELKRESLDGHLSSLKTASLPAVAAVGGMIVPAAIFIALNRGDAEAMRGWAIPVATDIAFALGVLALLGSRVPTALKAFLLSVAIFDDLGAIAIIAIFYTDELSGRALVVAGALLAGLVMLNWRGVRRPAAYILLGVPLWVALLKSGVHATLAGVALALTIPMRVNRNGDDSASVTETDPESPLHHIEQSLHPWVAFGVLPLFAFANAGVPLGDVGIPSLTHPVPLGVMLGLFVGKQLGIMSFSWLAVRLRLATLADGIDWRHVYGMSALCGIGFTMSFFIASLAFEQGASAYFGLERLAILVGSLTSAIAGFMILSRTLPRADGGPGAALDR